MKKDRDSKNNSWLNQSVYYQWITFERPIDVKLYTKKELNRVEQLGAGVYVYYIQAGGKVIYKSKVAELAKGLNGDLLEEFIKEAHKRGLKFVAGWLATIPGCGVEVKEHPDWISRHPDGSPSIVTVCYNTPYRDFLFSQVREVLKDYEVDGIYFDQLPVGCFCDYCKKQYEEMYGEKFPEFKNEQAYPHGPSLYPLPGESVKYGVNKSVCKKLHDFSTRMRISWIWNIRQAIKDTRPECSLILNRAEHIDAEPVKEYVDAFLPESGLPWSFKPLDTINKSLERSITSIYSKKPIWEVVKYDKMGVRSGSVDRLKTLTAEAVSNNHILVFRDQDTLDMKIPRFRNEVQKTMKEMSAVAKEMRRLPDNTYAALLHSKSTYHYSCDIANNSFYGMARFLIERHIPFRLVTEQDIQKDMVDDKVLIIPNCVCLEKRTVEGIMRYYKNGGSLVITARSGEFDENEKPYGKDILAEIVSIKRIGWKSNTRPYPVPLLKEIPIPSQHHSSYCFVKVSKDKHPAIENVEDALTDFNFGYVETENLGGKILAQICTFDQSLINAKHFNRRMPFPGEPRYPFLVVSQDKTRCAYFAAPVCNTDVRSSCEELQEIMEKTIRWCADAADVEPVDLPPSVKMTLKGSIAEGRIILLLHSTLLIGTKVIGYNNALVRLNCDKAKVKSCKSLIGGNVKIQEKGNYAEMLIEKIQPYEAIEILIKD